MAYVDASEVHALARDLAKAPARMERESKKVMKRSALEVKKGMQRDFSGHRYGGGVAGSLEFRAVGALAYEVGELDSAGPSWGIAAILAFGTSNNAPVVDHTRAVRREGLVMQEYLADAGEDSVFGAGG